MKSPATSGASRERCFTSRRALRPHDVSLNRVTEMSQGGEARARLTGGVKGKRDHGNDGQNEKQADPVRGLFFHPRP